MSSKGYTVGTYVIKSERKNSNLPICPICKKCKDRSICENRKNKKTMSKCNKCKKCTNAETGMRIGEVLALNYDEDIDLDNKMIKVTRTLTKDRNGKTIIGPVKTKSSKRNIEINELTEPIIKNSLNNKIKNKNKVLFCQENKKLYVDNTINSGFKRICKNAGIITPVNTHMLRHTFATRCIEAGVDLPVLQKFMGHANIETTINTYGDIYNYYKQKETQKVIDYLKRERA